LEQISIYNCIFYTYLGLTPIFTRHALVIGLLGSRTFSKEFSLSVSKK
jgi:hypothetical protein